MWQIHMLHPSWTKSGLGQGNRITDPQGPQGDIQSLTYLNRGNPTAFGPAWGAPRAVCKRLWKLLAL